MSKSLNEETGYRPKPKGGIVGFTFEKWIRKED